MAETVLVTGGCGFIGSNLVERLLGRGFTVRVLDDLSRPGSELNLVWLQSLRRAGELDFRPQDVRAFDAVRHAMQGVATVFHLAAQVAVTSSVADPRRDMEVNLLGTFNVLEGAREATSPPLIVYNSTNKVYGKTTDIPLVELPTRYSYADGREGISEEQPLDFHSPYGCSKGSADQYVRDYGRIYGIPTVVLRASCIYGPHQLGNEDQGWVAHFLISALRGSPVTIYGDGKQVRDLLYVGDLLDLYDAILDRPPAAEGQVFNVGGGAENSISIWREFGPLIARFLARETPASYDSWRPGDQKVYISDNSRAVRTLGWTPKVGIGEGLERLAAWLRSEHAGR